MTPAARTVVTFHNSRFNTSESRDYFINPCCFGDDVARWLIAQLRGEGYETDEAPGQEDFGWFFNFTVSFHKHCLVIGLQPGDDDEEATWIGWVELSRRFTPSLLGRDGGVESAAVNAIHKALSAAPSTRNIRWHFRQEFDRNPYDPGTPMPSSD
jgi:hypothetical protein